MGLWRQATSRASIQQLLPVLLGFFCTAFLVQGSVGRNDASTGPDAKGRAAIRLLASVPTGRGLLDEAKTKWSLSRDEELLKLFKWGAVSKTDAVLTRHFDPNTGTERKERHVTIHLKESEPVENMVLDMAHEMTHAIRGPEWDPYDPALTAGKYISLTLEADGGEVDALAAECQVSLELGPRLKTADRRCSRYLTADGTQIDREAVREDFYRIGKWYRGFAQKLGAEAALFPRLSSKAARLHSSTGRAPYPVALYREFREMTRIACENSRRRIGIVERWDGRAPASVRAARGDTQRFIQLRCRRPSA